MSELTVVLLESALFLISFMKEDTPAAFLERVKVFSNTVKQSFFFFFFNSQWEEEKGRKLKKKKKEEAFF